MTVIPPPENSNAGTPPTAKASEVLATFKVETEIPLYIVGSFESNATVLSQQTRALNVAWALIESLTVPMGDESRKRLAIVGAGFAGLTLAAGLLQKKSALDITLFEEWDTLLPLQQGSDSRWLHPHIYEWPAEGSESIAAMLPVLNWTAGRASDVVVQVLGEWRQLIMNLGKNSNEVRLFCNTRHLQVGCDPDVPKMSKIEWVGDQRDPADGTGMPDKSVAGLSESFDFVVLTVGFGIEQNTTESYWRNETLGQPILKQERCTYLVSGQGDGAMVDLLRIRISQYRQDRILEELFAGKNILLKKLKTLKAAYSSGNLENALFKKFESLGEDDSSAKIEMKCLLDGLRHRLRRDTDAILRLKVVRRHIKWNIRAV